jgi:hypothetical protein
MLILNEDFGMSTQIWGHNFPNNPSPLFIGTVNIDLYITIRCQLVLQILGTVDTTLGLEVLPLVITGILEKFDIIFHMFQA